MDTTFGIGGKVITVIGGGGCSSTEAYSVAIQTDGKIIQAGYHDDSIGYGFVLVRYNSNGSLDSTFGNGGMVKDLSFGIGNDGLSIVLQTDGKIVLAGSASVGNSAYNQCFALVRFNSDGTLDTTFGTGGKVSTIVGNSNDFSYSVVIQTDGKIVAVGKSRNGNNYNFALARYNNDGTLDPTFGNGGIVVTTTIGSGLHSDCAYSVALQMDGKIVVTGSSLSFGFGNSYVFALARYNSNGILDTSFGNGGIVTTNLGIGYCKAYSVVIQTDGKIVAAGISYGDFALARYNNNGTLDSTFGNEGKILTDFGSGDIASSIALQADGKIVVVGNSGNNYDYDFAIARYNNDVSNVAEVSITTKLEDIKINVYPNPFNSSATIEFNSTTRDAELNMYNLYGQKVKTIQGISGEEIKLQRDNLTSGVYFINITEENKTIATDKLIIAD